MFAWRRCAGFGHLEKARVLIALSSGVKKMSFKISFKPKLHHPKEGLVPKFIRIVANDCRADARGFLVKLFILMSGCLACTLR